VSPSSFSRPLLPASTFRRFWRSTYEMPPDGQALITDHPQWARTTATLDHGLPWPVVRFVARQVSTGHHREEISRRWPGEDSKTRTWNELGTGGRSGFTRMNTRMEGGSEDGNQITIGRRQAGPWDGPSQDVELLAEGEVLQFQCDAGAKDRPENGEERWQDTHRKRIAARRVNSIILSSSKYPVGTVWRTAAIPG
jgi:hypothetical protein